MKVILYNAVSVDGFIAGKNDDTDWISQRDWDYFTNLVAQNGVVIYGARTYYEVGLKYGTLPIDGVLNVVMTKQTHHKKENVLLFNGAPSDCIANLEKQGYESVVLAGGGMLNASFLAEKLIDEIILSVHPVVISDGTKLFNGESAMCNLELLELEKFKELVRLTYKVSN